MGLVYELPLQTAVGCHYRKCSFAAMIDGTVFGALIFCHLFMEAYRELRSLKSVHLIKQGMTMKAVIISDN